MVHWTEDIETHATALTTWLEEILCGAFPKGRVKPKKAYVSEATWDTRTQRIGLRRQLATVKAENRLADCEVLF